MGIFSSKKKTYVSSVVYNMAGDELERPNYLKTTVIGSTLNQQRIAQVLTNSYLQGPGMRFRTFAKWAKRTNYEDTVGLVSAKVMTGDSIDVDIIDDVLSSLVGSYVQVQSASVGEAEYTYWADQWVAANFPERLGLEYVSDFDEESNTITITWPDTTTDTLTPIGFDPAKNYLYVTYNTVGDDEIMPEEEGDPVVLDEEDEWPDVTGWALIDEETVDDTTFTTYRRTRYMGQAPDRDATYTLTETMIFAENNVTEEREYRIDTQVTYHSVRSPLVVYIYEQYSGNTQFDGMFGQNDSMSSFFPFIPFRIDNKFVSESYLPDVYDQAKKAYKKATTGKYDKMIENIDDNESIDDIDFAYCVFGVSLNVLENAAKKYIYKFFQEILNDYSEDGSYDSWKASWEAADASRATWAEWRAAQADEDNPLYGTPEPSQIPYPPAPLRSIRIASDRRDVMSFDMTIKWRNMVETTGTGLGKDNARPGEVWLSVDREEEFEEWFWSEEDGQWYQMPGMIIAADVVSVNWQDSANTWRKISITGLQHRNQIYNGKAVEITGKEALEDPEESGFIVPLHEGIYRSMGLKDGTQMATACSFMVFNCYQVVKEKWYQSDWFQIILIVIIVVVAIYTGYYDPSLAGGVLGGNAAVGAALGLSGTAAIIAGAVANAIAAMLIMRVVNKAAVALFGEKWGAIIGAIAGVIALQVGSAMAQGQSMASAFGNMMRAENLLKLTSAVGQGYQGYVQASIQDMQQEAQQVMSDYEAESRKVRTAWAETFGTDRGIIDPLSITEAFGVSPESVDSFLQRTLMTGSDVAELSLDMLTDFVDMTLNTNLPT